MELYQLEAFVAAIDNKSFSAAAEALFLTQPTVSAHIRSLEKELQVQLINRTTKSFEPTPQGMRLYRYASTMLHLQKKAVKELSALYQRELHIGASSVPGQYLLPRLLTEYRKRHKDIRFVISSAGSMDVIQQVLEGSLDIGFTGTSAASGCASIPIATDEPVIIAPNTPHYRQLLRQQVSLDKLFKEPLLVRTGSSGTRLETNRFLRTLGLDLSDMNIVASMSDAAALQSCVIQGLGISIVSRQAAEKSADQGELLIFPFGQEHLCRKLYLIYKKDRFLPEAVQKFIEFVLRKSK